MTALQSTDTTSWMETTMTATTLSDDDLRALALQHEQAAREAAAEVERRDAERAEAEAARERERDARLVLAAVSIEADLVESARQAEAEFSAALASGDLSAAFLAFVRRKASRPARQALRDAQRAAEQNAQTGARLLAPEMLTYDRAQFLEAVEAEAERLAGERGYADGQALVKRARDGEVA